MHFDNYSEDFIKEFSRLVSNSKSTIITSHTSPDDDSITSVLTIYNLITSDYPDKKVRIVYTGKPDERYRTFQNYDKIMFVEDLADNLEGADLLIGLDGSQYSRYSKKPEALVKFAGQTICIDHHNSPIDEYSLSLVVTSASSNAEIIYNCFYKDRILSQGLIETFLLGILGDTGTFNYVKWDGVSVFDIAKRLISEGKIEIQEFKSRYETISQNVFHLIQELVKNAQFGTIKNWPNFLYSSLSRDFVDKGTYTDSEISDASHIFMSSYLRTIENYPWGFVVTPKSDGRCSISCRSLPKSVNVRDLSERMNLGGGHDRAAGGTFKPIDGNSVRSEDCIQKVLTWIENNKPNLN